MVQMHEWNNDTYEILPEKLGEGTAGEVYLAWHKNLRKKVVIKKIKEHYVGKINERREADILKNLHHPCLPQVYDFVQMGFEVYTVIDYIDGNTMAEYIRAGVRFREAQIICWLRELLEALNYLHSQNPPIIHGDIKPSNIMISEDGRIFLIDFNVSFGQDEERPMSGYSRLYASPEQLYRAKLYATRGNYKDIPVDQRSDIFSLSASIYNLMTGKHASDRIRNGQPLFDGETVYSEELCRIIAKGLERKLEDRYGSAEAMLNDLLTIKKRDREYVRLEKKHFFVTLAASLGIAAGVLLILIGSRYRLEDGYHNEAVKADSYYSSGNYEEAVKTADEALSDSSPYRSVRSISSETTEELLKTAAESSFEIDEAAAANHDSQSGDYTDSIGRFRELIEYCEHTGELKAFYFRDLAIAQARDEKTDDAEAEATIQEAKNQGFSDSSLLLARAEIDLDNDDAGTAIKAAQEVLDGNPGDEEKFRAYIVRARGYCLNKDYDEYVLKLKDACNDPVMQRHKTYEDRLLNELEIACRNAVDEAKDKTRYYDILKQAWELTYERKTADGTMTASDYISYANALTMGEEDEEYYRNAQQILLDAAGRDSVLNEDYRIWAELAILEAAKLENAGSDKVIDYSAFQNYYNKAEELFKQNGGQNDEDEEMEELENLYSKLKAAGKVS